MKLASYPKVYNLGHAYLEDLFKDPVLIQEKIDGSQFSFGVIGGELFARSKGAVLHVEAPDKMFAKAVETAKARQAMLQDGFVYRGEYLSKPKHNTLAYARVPKDHVILYDVTVGEEKYLPNEAVQAEAARIGLEAVPTFTAGVLDLEHLKALLNCESVLGGCKIEGLVLKNYKRFGLDGKVLMGKLVSDAFRESHNKEWKVSNPGLQDVIQQIIESLRHERRYEKAVEHLRDAGTLTNTPRDIGPLIKAVQQDIYDEERAWIAEKLVAWAIGDIQRGSTRGLAEWYKDYLAKSQGGLNGIAA